MHISKTLYDKIWDNHLVYDDGKTSLIFVDRHLIHEVTSPQAFDGLRINQRIVRWPSLTFATMDHNVSTKTRDWGGAGEISKKQMEVLKRNCEEFGIKLYDLNHPDQGIVHVIGPEMGLTLPGTVIVCGDSHTSTHGAFGALAFGIGTSEVEHVLATQTLIQKKAKNMLIQINGKLNFGVTPKDVILYIIGKITTKGGTGYVIEYAGDVIRSLSMEGRMTICNMSIEAGAKAGLISPDQTTYEYLKNKDFSPKGEDFEKAVEFWDSLKTDPEAKFDKIYQFNGEEIEPMVTWGTNPGQVIPITGKVPDPNSFSDPVERDSAIQALTYMGIEPNTVITEIRIDKVFIGSCTNSRIEDLRRAAAVAKTKLKEGKKVHPKVQAIVVPGSGRVYRQAVEEGLDKIFKDAGFEWRFSGCSMCLAMNDDYLLEGERCASTSNRNFEGRQGRGGRTHLVSPEMAVAAAIEGHFVDIREYIKKEDLLY